MDWGIVYQALFFLDIALLAIVITIFVFASSLLGRSIELTKKQHEVAIAAEEKERQESIKNAREMINTLSMKPLADKNEVGKAQESFDALTKKFKEFDKKSKSIMKQYSLFTVNGGIGQQSILFLLSGILSGIAWSVNSSSELAGVNPKLVLTTVLFGLSVICVATGLWRLYSLLKRIQEVALTSEEAASRQMIEAFKTAQRQIMIELKPKLSMSLINKLPISLKSGEKIEIEFAIDLEKGNFANNIESVIIVPKGFELESNRGKVGAQSPTAAYCPGQPRCQFTTTQLLLATTWRNSCTLKATQQNGNYEILYRVQCEGYVSDSHSFQITAL
jgi:hypothetical protein